MRASLAPAKRASARAQQYRLARCYDLSLFEDGVTGRALLHAVSDGDPARFRSMSGRFSRPVLPGEPLAVSVWLTGDGESALFQTARADGTVVIDRGRVQFSGGNEP